MKTMTCKYHSYIYPQILICQVKRNRVLICKRIRCREVLLQNCERTFNFIMHG